MQPLSLSLSAVGAVAALPQDRQPAADFWLAGFLS
jgi:hypothetical protein